MFFPFFVVLVSLLNILIIIYLNGQRMCLASSLDLSLILCYPSLSHRDSSRCLCVCAFINNDATLDLEL